MTGRRKQEFELEVCVDSVASAVAAARGGADRLELCGHLLIGGVTPTLSLFSAVRRAVQIPLHVMIRPRFGDFCYSGDEYRLMLEDAGRFISLGAEGIVCGILERNGSLDLPRLRQLRELAGTRVFTLHRAFDVSRDPMESLEDAGRLGVDILLSSGQQDRAVEGLGLLQRMQESAAPALRIQAGSAVNAANIPQIYRETGIHCFHLSGKAELESPMTFRREGVHMGLPGISEYLLERTSEDKVREAKRVLEKLRQEETC